MMTNDGPPHGGPILFWSTDEEEQMSEAQKVPGWLPDVEAAVAKFSAADPEVRHFVCEGIGERHGVEAEAKARELFARPPLHQRRAVVETKAAEIAAELDAAEPPAKIDPPKPPVKVPPPLDGAAAVVNTSAEYEVARRFLQDRYSDGKILTLRWWGGEWRCWTGTHYAEIEKDALRAKLYEWLATINSGKFDPTARYVSNVIDAITAHALLSREVEGGTWLGDGEPPWGRGEVICCKNGVLRLSDGKLWPHDPRLFTLNVIETEYRPGKEASRWQQFLNEVWGRDVVSRDALQELFGLVLTDITRFQKGFILVGPARSGKGTIARVLMHLLGRANYCGPSLGDLSQQFGMQGLIGKKIAVVPDARLDNRANRSVITEKLLSIIGEDVQEINRKNKLFWSGILRLRVLILSNELPDFKDDTGVIATRFVILQTRQSFLGREDTGLEEKLCGELSGILNWALEGWQRLVERGKFAPPGNGELNDELAGIASSIKAFVAERCELGGEFTVEVGRLHKAFRSYCEGGGGWADRQMPPNQFSGKLRAAFPGQIDVIRPRVGNSERKRMFAGIRLQKIGSL